MHIRVRLFARYREAAGRERIDLDLPEGGTVESAWSAVAERHPELARYRPFTLFAVGHEYVTPEERLHPDDELCLFPPVSGGAGGDTYRVVTAPLSPDAIAATIEEPGAGGIVIFSGVVRHETGGRPVKFLEYEAHAPMAEAKMREIADRLERKHDPCRVVLHHRTGDLAIGEVAVIVVAGAPHRDAAFKAAREAIDELKTVVPIWKKEHAEDGAIWIEEHA